MKKFVFLFVCVSAVGIASALECYKCKGPGCDSETKSWGKSSCGVVSGSHPGVCVKVNYKDQSSKPMVERKCMTTEIKDGKPIYSCSVDNGVVTECSKCQTDLCNSATSVRVSLLTLFSILVTYMASKVL